jgi:hypothetical protein
MINYLRFMERRGVVPGRARPITHSGKRYLVYQFALRAFPPGATTATHWSAVIADGYAATPAELAAALDAFESRRDRPAKVPPDAAAAGEDPSSRPLGSIAV